MSKDDDWDEDDEPLDSRLRGTRLSHSSTATSNSTSISPAKRKRGRPPKPKTPQSALTPLPRPRAQPKPRSTATPVASSSIPSSDIFFLTALFLTSSDPLRRRWVGVNWLSSYWNDYFLFTDALEHKRHVSYIINNIWLFSSSVSYFPDLLEGLQTGWFELYRPPEIWVTYICLNRVSPVFYFIWNIQNRSGAVNCEFPFSLVIHNIIPILYCSYICVNKTNCLDIDMESSVILYFTVSTTQTLQCTGFRVNFFKICYNLQNN